jgi:hypothetical protein
MEWKPIACRPTGRLKMKWKADVKCDVKVMKICHWKKQAKCSMTGNGSLSRPKLTNSCSTEGEEGKKR